MPLFTRGCLVLLVMIASACHGSDALTLPADVAVTVSSPNTNVLFGSTEQMTATGSDGRVLTNGSYTFNFTQLNDVVSGRVFLAAILGRFIRGCSVRACVYRAIAWRFHDSHGRS